MLKNYDEQLFLKIFNFCNKTNKRTKFFETLNTTSKPLFLVIYTICIVLLFKTNNSILPTFIFYPALLLGINLVMRKTFKRKRPFQNENLQNKKLNPTLAKTNEKTNFKASFKTDVFTNVENVEPLEPIEIGKSDSYSFPSNHASSSLIISYFILYINIYFGLFMLFLAVVTSFSRVARGYHYPFDILCSLVLSTTLFLISLVLPLTLLIN